jgi:thioredoxin
MINERRSTIISIANNNLDILSIDSDFVYVLFFEADWCGPCHVLLPIIRDLSSDYADHACFIRVNADKNNKVAKQYQIKQLPTLVFIYKGKEYKRIVGMTSTEEMQKSIFEY